MPKLSIFDLFNKPSSLLSDEKFTVISYTCSSL